MDVFTIAKELCIAIASTPAVFHVVRVGGDASLCLYV
jgi:hypothetical protein